MTLLIHPGFHKTGTSWLQEQLFTDTRLFNMMLGHQEIWETIVEPHDFLFDPDLASMAIASRRSPSDERRIDVISSEILCGTRVTGQRDSRLIADRLAAITGPAKVLLTVRSQPPILKSSYLQYVKRGGRKKVKEFLTFKPEPGYFVFSPSLLEFHHLVEHYGELYGDANVLVLPQEILFRDRHIYMRTLVEFVTGSPPPPEIVVSSGGNVGKSPPASGIFLLRLASHFRRTPINPDPVLRWDRFSRLLMSAGYSWSLGEKAASRAMQAEIDEMVRGRFGRSNHRLQRFCPFDLVELGYEVEPA